MIEPIDFIIQTKDGQEYRIDSTVITKGGRHCIPDDMEIETIYMDILSRFED